MEFFALNSNVTILAACVLIIFVVLQTIIDLIDDYRLKKLHRYMIDFAKKHAVDSFTVLLKASNSKSTLDAVESLRAQKYHKLQIIVLVEHGKSDVRSKLDYYRRKNRTLNLKIVQKRANLTDADILNRYGNGKLCMILGVNHRLSENFFTIASIEARTFGKMVILPIHSFKPSKTVASALCVNDKIFNQIKARLFGEKIATYPMRQAIIYDRAAIFSKKAKPATVKVNPSQNIYISQLAPTRKIMQYFKQAISSAASHLKTLMGAASFILVVGLMLWIGFTVGLQKMMILVGFIGVIYCLMGVAMQLRLKGYNFMHRSDLALAEPINFLTVIIIYLLGLIKFIVDIFSRKKNLTDNSTDQYDGSNN